MLPNPARELKIVNRGRNSGTFLHNAFVPAEKYQGTNWRCLEEINYALGPEFSRFTSQLKPRSDILLPGGGYSIYGIELANLGHDVLSINAQNFYKELSVQLTDLGAVLKTSLYDDEKREFESISNIPINVLNRLASAFRIPFPKSIYPPKRFTRFPIVMERWRVKPQFTEEQVMTEIFTFIDLLIKSINGDRHRPPGRVELVQGLVQQFVPCVSDGSFDLIIDFMDALTYSSDRINLLNLYHAKLKPGGRAYLCIDLICDLVELKRPESLSRFKTVPDEEGKVVVELPNYLQTLYPNNFRGYLNPIKVEGKLPVSAEPHRSRADIPVLVLQRNASDGLGQFARNLRVGNLWTYDIGEGMIAPVVEYSET